MAHTISCFFKSRCPIKHKEMHILRSVKSQTYSTILLFSCQLGFDSSVFPVTGLNPCLGAAVHPIPADRRCSRGLEVDLDVGVELGPQGSSGGSNQGRRTGALPGTRPHHRRGQCHPPPWRTAMRMHTWQSAYKNRHPQLGFNSAGLPSLLLLLTPGSVWNSSMPLSKFEARDSAALQVPFWLSRCRNIRYLMVQMQIKQQWKVRFWWWVLIPSVQNTY